MSMSLTAQAMGMKVGNAIRKLVLLKLADQANDKGECWPSYASIAEAAECSARAVINHIRWLEEHGFLRIENRKIGHGQNLTNVYHLMLANGRAEDGESGSQGSESGSQGVMNVVHPNQSIQPINEPISANADTRGARVVPANTPAEDLSCRPSENPSAKPAKRKPSAARRELDALNLLADRGVDGALAQDYLAVRKDKRAITLTKTALAGLEREANRAGLSLSQAVTLCCERGWVGFRAEWLHEHGSLAGRRNPVKDVPVHTVGGAFLAKDVL